MSEEKERLQKVIDRIMELLSEVRRYRVPVFLAFVAIIYVALLFRIHTLTNIQPTPDQVNSQVKAIGIPHIDEEVVRQIQALQDNSVNVQALFNQARSNPFQSQ